MSAHPAAATAGSTAARRARHRHAVLLALPAILLAGMFAAPGEETRLALLVLAVALTGVPHGALDLDVARFLWPLDGTRALALFAAGYLGLALLVGLVWALMPLVALAAFLAYSAVHFGADWQGEAPWGARLGAGASIVTLPAVLHGETVGGIFALLAPGADVAPLVDALAALAPLTLLAAPVVSLTRGRAGAGVAAEIALIQAAALLLAPLLFFAVYFGLLHAVRHLIETAGDLALTPRAALGRSLPLSLLTLAGIAALAIWRAGGGAAVSPDEGIVSAIFVALAALTVPHMLLIGALDRRRGRAGPSPSGG